MSKAAVAPGEVLLKQVRGGLIAQGTSLSRWSRDRGVSRQYSALVLTGRRNGRKAKTLRSELMAAAGLNQ